MTIETKYNTGDMVWVMYHNHAIEGRISKVYFTQFISPATYKEEIRITYSVHVTWSNYGSELTDMVAGINMFDTRDDLIASL